MPDEIQPPMTEEEWRTPGIEWMVNGRRCSAECYTDRQGGMVNVLFVESGRSAVTGRQRHALAALCLHGQTFGFTVYDIARLRDAAKRLGESGHWPDEISGLLSIADRIAKLLPPEPTDA